ncbi:MAG: helix-turn-helix domain-containing protein [Oligoflexales bacterium]
MKEEHHLQISRYLAENMETLRRKKGFSQEQMAKLAGIPRTTLTSIESGSGNPSLANLVRIAAALHVSVEELLSRPRGDCLLVTRDQVPVQERNRGQAALHKLLPDKIKGLEIDRIEIKAAGTMGGHPHVVGTKEYMVGLEGEIMVHVAGQEFLVRPGDVLAFPGDQRHSYRNAGKQKAAALSVVVPVPADI